MVLHNRSAGVVTNPTITVTSGHNAALFPGITAFPVSASQATLSTGSEMLGPEMVFSAVPVNFQSGFDSGRALDRTLVPVGGAQQVVTVSARLTDPKFPGGHFKIGIFTPSMPGSSILSSTVPSNLTEGESITIGTPDPPSGVGWVLSAARLGKVYVFTATLQVTNPFGIPFFHRPRVDVGAVFERFESSPDVFATGSSVVVTDETLDGAIAGSGTITFSVAEPGLTWSRISFDSTGVTYTPTAAPPTAAAQCQKGGWQTFEVFKNQGDCVSYVATKGKNPPAR